MLWARLEREQPCVARRHVEQQRQQRAVRESQQQHTDERQQQYWFSLCEGDSEGGWRQRPPASTGQNARVYGLPRRPARKPTSRSLFPAAWRRETKTECGRGLVATVSTGANAPVPPCAPPGARARLRSGAQARVSTAGTSGVPSRQECRRFRRATL